MGYHSNHFSLGVFSLVFALNIWLIHPSWALEGGELYDTLNGSVTPIRLQSPFSTVFSKRSTSGHWVVSVVGTNSSSRIRPFQRMSPIGSGSGSSNPQNNSSKYQVGSLFGGSHKSPISSLQLSDSEVYSSAGLPKRKKSSIQKARESLATAAASGALPSQHSDHSSVAYKTLFATGSPGGAALQHSSVQSPTRLSFSSVASLGSVSGQGGAYSVTHKSDGSSESSPSESPPSQSSTSPSLAGWNVSLAPSPRVLTSQRWAGAASPNSQSQSLVYGVRRSSSQRSKRSSDSPLPRLTTYPHSDLPQLDSSKSRTQLLHQAEEGVVAANVKPTLAPQKAVVIGVRTSNKSKSTSAPQKAVKAPKKSFLDVPGRNARIQSSASSLSHGWTVRQTPATEIYRSFPSRPKMGDMFEEADEEGLEVRAALTAIGSLDCFKTPRFLREEGRLYDHFLELVISYLHGDLLSAYGKERDSVLKRVIEERYPQTIRYQLSRHNSGDHRFREEDLSYDADDITRKVKGIFSPQTDFVLKDVSKIFPYFTYHSGRLGKIWPFVRPGRLFKTMGEVVYWSVREMIRGNYWEQVELMSSYALNLCLLARRYECRGTQYLASRIYMQLNYHYALRVSKLTVARNRWTEILLEEMKRFVKDPRFWQENENGQLDFNLETAL